MMEYGRILGLDYGDKRIGVAVSDGLGLTAQPYPFIDAEQSPTQAILALCNELGIVEIMLGLPKRSDGSDSEKATQIREFGETIAQLTGLPVTYRDERFSTVAVTRTLIAADVSRKKRKSVVNGQAAAFVLQGYLDYLRSSGKLGLLQH